MLLTLFKKFPTRPVDYSTYVQGRNAILFDAKLVDWMKRELSMFWALTWVYHSNWRVLHVDGFDGYRIPIVSYGFKMRKFFNYATEDVNASL